LTTRAGIPGPLEWRLDGVHVETRVILAEKLINTGLFISDKTSQT
jgi:hypothetical protein